MATLFERLGGQEAISKAVVIFYKKVMNDERVNHFFKEIDMDEQIEKQKCFLTMVFGGPNDYTGKDLREAHKHLVEQGLKDTHVDIIIEYLTGTLHELGVKDNDISIVSSIANSARYDVLNR